MSPRPLRARAHRLHPYFLYRRLEPSYRAAESLLAGLRYGRPGRRLRLVGVTGTDGKTTTCSYVAAVLEEAGHSVGLSSSALEQLGDSPESHSRELTTPQPRVLQRLLAEMVEAGAEWAVLEVSSHSLALGRVSGLSFEVGVVTNVTPEHLAFHGSLAGYLGAKAKLFRSRPRLAVLNRDDPISARLEGVAAGRKLFFGRDRTADVWASEVECGPAESRFTLQTPIGSRPVRLRLPGLVNVENALAAASVGVGVGVGLEAIAEGLERVQIVPGRFDRLESEDGFSVVIDFGHTPVALEKLYTFLRETTSGRLIAVLGSEGGVWRGKRTGLEEVPGWTEGYRAGLAEVTGRSCEYTVLTVTYPAWEDPVQIVDDLEEGIRLAGKERGADYERELDRREAFRRAFAHARRGDVVVITGLGHKSYLSVRGTKTPWSDHEVAAELLAERKRP